MSDTTERVQLLTLSLGEPFSCSVTQVGWKELALVSTTDGSQLSNFFTLFRLKDQFTQKNKSLSTLKSHEVSSSTKHIWSFTARQVDDVCAQEQKAPYILPGIIQNSGNPKIPHRFFCCLQRITLTFWN